MQNLDYGFIWGVIVGVATAVTTGIMAIGRLVGRVSKLEHDMEEVKEDNVEAKCARLEAAKNIETVKDKLYEVSGNVDYIRGLLQKAVSKDGK